MLLKVKYGLFIHIIYIYIYIYLYICVCVCVCVCECVCMICKNKSRKLILHVLLSSTKNSVKSQFICLYTINQYPFQTVMFSISHLFAHFKCLTVLFDLLIGPYQV